MIANSIKVLFRLNKDEKETFFLGVYKSKEKIEKVIEADKNELIKFYKKLYEHFEEQNPDYSLNEYEYIIKEYNLDDLE